MTTTRAMVVLLAGVSVSAAVGRERPAVDPRVQVREGFELTVAVADVERARFMAVGPNGTLFVSQPHLGQVKACRDEDRDGWFETVATFVSGHPTVHGLLWHDGWLWFTETGAIFKARDADGVADGQQTVIAEGRLPRGGGHWYRSIAIHDGRLYTGIGDSGNITDETDSERQKIWTFDLQGQDKRPFASGLRNTEKLVIRPDSNEVWGMDHGSDWFGRQLEGSSSPHGQPITSLNPPDEMNHYVDGGFYGHPFIVGSKLPRYEYMDRPDIVELAARTIPPAWSAGAHWAPNAMTFYTGGQFPDEYRGDAFVAYHGSWNRQPREGYCVTRVLFDRGRPYGELIYVNFLTADRAVLGRPVDVVVAADGSLLISDDQAGRVYRLSYAAVPSP